MIFNEEISHLSGSFSNFPCIDAVNSRKYACLSEDAKNN